MRCDDRLGIEPDADWGTILAASPFVGTRFQFCSDQRPTKKTSPNLMSRLKARDLGLLSIHRKPLRVAARKRVVTSAGGE
jgi:hypothetical protein